MLFIRYQIFPKIKGKFKLEDRETHWSGAWKGWSSIWERWGGDRQIRLKVHQQCNFTLGAQNCSRDAVVNLLNEQHTVEILRQSFQHKVLLHCNAQYYSIIVSRSWSYQSPHISANFDFTRQQWNLDTSSNSDPYMNTLVYLSMVRPCEESWVKEADAFVTSNPGFWQETCSWLKNSLWCLLGNS